MKKTKLLAGLVLMLALIISACGAHKSQAYYDYKSKIIGTELDGTYTIRAYGRARNAADAYEQARKQAVYDVCFNDIQFATGTSASSSKTLHPLIDEVNAKTKYEDYFNAFLADKGEYENYTNFCSKNERRILSSKFARTDAQTVAQVTVCVDRKALKEKLIKDNIIKK